MKNLVLLIFLLTTFCSFAQNTPVITIKEDSSQLKLSNLKVDVKIIGNFATVTYDMKFFNELDRILEGELSFPLGEGQSVSKFAMDVNGKLREAVIVEKEIARVAYESTIRQKIDPGLLEKVQGNNYKARVYPISPNAYKQLIISYEQELFTNNNYQLFELPLSLSEKLDEFELNIEVLGGKKLPLIKNNPYKELILKPNQTSYSACIVKKEHIPSLPITMQIPVDASEDKILSYRDYFYAYKTLKPATRLKAKPKKMTILWDASYSIKFKNVEAELELLKSYIKYLGTVEVQFISFSNAIHQNETLVVNNKNWMDLEQLIRAVRYDGGTCFNLFDDLTINADETLFFTDGLNNLGEWVDYKGATYTINSTVSASHEALRKIATRSGGSYINLVRLPQQRALKILKEEPYQFLGVKHSDYIEEVYPTNNVNVTTDFAITGRFKKDGKIELLFGYGGKVTERVNLSVKKTTGDKVVKRLWAKQKLKFLNQKKKENKAAIIRLAKQYHLLSDYTSMLILDRIEDYVRYRIEPPQELKQAYKERIANVEQEDAYLQEEIADRKQELVEDYKDILDWHNTTYPKKAVKKARSNSNIRTNRSTAQSENKNSVMLSNIEPLELNGTKRKITGIVTDDTGEPLIGANIVIQGTTNGTVADLDGNFSIYAEPEDNLEFSYIGCESQLVLVGNFNKIDVALNTRSILDDIVITALEEESSESKAYSVTIVKTETSQLRNSNSNNQFKTSNKLNAQSLYVLDGTIVKGNPLDSIKQEDIEFIEVLDTEKATKVFGEQAANGATIIVTKRGKEENKEAIDKLNDKIADKIELKAWNPDVPYIKVLEEEPTIETAYNKYLEIRNQYSNSLSFYIDVADFFDRKENRELAVTVLTNLMEVELDNYELMNALAYKLEYFEQYELAVIVYEKVLELRPEDPQSYRNLALAYEQIGAIQKSFDLLFKIYNGELLHKDMDERFYGIEHIAYVELCRLHHMYKKKLKSDKAQTDSLRQLPVDVRVVIDWNHNDTDIDLHITDPTGEKCFYSNPKTKIGGQMSNDMMDGFGPEEFMLKKAVKGDYEIMIDYFSDNVQKISGPAFLKVTLFTNYGRANEEKEIIIVRLENEEDELEIGNVKF